jgi:hypothetical protein
MTIRQFGVLLFLMVSGTPTILTAQARRPTLHVAALDTVIRQFWRAMAAEDSAMVRRLTVGDQPKQAAYLFGKVTPENAELGMPRPEPRLRVRGDTAWRAYWAPATGYIGALNYTARLEWRCGSWRIRAISADAAAH